MTRDPNCLTCRYFENAASAVEAALPGLASLSSAYGAVRAQDGICAQRSRYVAASAWCADHSPRDQARA